MTPNPVASLAKGKCNLKELSFKKKKKLECLNFYQRHKKIEDVNLFTKGVNLPRSLYILQAPDYRPELPESKDSG